MKIAFTINSDTRVVLEPENAKDKQLNRLAFDGNIAVAIDLDEDGSLIFILKAKE